MSPLTPDHVNPERPWPQIDELAERTAAAGLTLRERLTIYPGYLREPWLDPRLAAHVAALADPATGLAREDARPAGLPWQEPDGGWGEASGRTDLHVTIDTAGRTADRREDFSEVYGDWAEVATRIAPEARRDAVAAPRRLRPEVAAALRSAERDPAGITDSEALALLDADGPELEALAALADGLRRDVMGDDVTYVVTRNINFTNVCYTGCRFCAFAQRRTDADAYTLSMAQIGDRAEEAWAAGATEVCMQGGIHPDLPGTAYFDIAAEVKRAGARSARARVLAHGGGQRRVPDRAEHPGLAGAGPGSRGRLAARHGRGDPRRRRALGAHQGQAPRVRLDRGHHHRP